MATTLDGRIATRTGHAQWISGCESRRDVHRLRAQIGHAHGAILIGGNTFRQDNPSLTWRDLEETAPQPKAIILTSHLPDPSEPYTLLKERPKDTIFCTPEDNCATPLAQKLMELGVSLVPYTSSLASLFQTLLTTYNIPYILCEGGGKLALSLLKQNLVDTLTLYVAPLILADNAATPLFTGLSPNTLSDGLRFEMHNFKRLDQDLKITLKPVPQFFKSPT